ncbi:MAG: protein kinase [Acidobacteriota bacterium]
MSDEPRDRSEDDGPPDSNEELLLRLEEEFEDALLRGERPSIDDYCERHPALADSLRPALQASLLLHDVGLDSDEAGPPSRLGRFDLGEALGAGGMATVHRARDVDLQRDVALKVFHPRGADARHGRDRFLREARSLARLRHPRVVAVHEVGEQEGWCYLATELLAGSLQDHVPPPEVELDLVEQRRAVGWIVEAAEGLAHAHAQGVLHRDVKPANLLLDADGRASVADFGLARLEGQAELTRTGERLGTPGYWSPEQVSGRPVDVRSDVHSLGTTLRVLLTGALPEAPEDRSRWRRVPARLQAIIERATAPVPDRRHADMTAFRDELVAWLEGRPTPSERRRRARSRTLLVTMGLLVVAAAMLAWRERPLPHGGWLIEHGTRERQGAPRPPVIERVLRDAAGWDERDPTQPFVMDGSSLQVAVESRLRGPRVVLRRDGETVAGVRLDETSVAGLSNWTLRANRDLDGDDLPDFLLGSNQQVSAWVKLEPEAWGPGEGWRRRLGSDPSHGSVTVTDWDGDGRLEILVGESGLLGDHPADTPARLRSFDLTTGDEERSWPLEGMFRSTPQLLRTRSGHPIAVFADSDSTRSLREGRLGPWLHRIDVASGEVLARHLGEEHHFGTRPVFVDVGDGGLAGVLAGSWTYGPTDAAGRLTSSGELTLWTSALDEWWTWGAGGRLSSPLLTEQDGRSPTEACIVVGDRLDCLLLSPELPPAERTLWSAALPTGDFVENAPVSVGDLDGDGFDEVAAGTRGGRVLVAGRRATEGRHALLSSPPTNEDGGRPSITARPASWRDPSTGRLQLVACTGTGSVLGWDGLRHEEPAWSFETAGGILASPRVVWLTAERPTVLVASSDRWLYLLEPPATSGAAPRITWSYCAEGGLDGTPSVVEVDGTRWVVFTDRSRHVSCVPLLTR